jgi:hypothetical protein
MTLEMELVGINHLYIDVVWEGQSMNESGSKQANKQSIKADA